MIVRPEDFNSETPPPRIIGVECEYNLQFPSNVSLSQYINDESLAAAGISHHGSFLGQRGGGGKLYADVGHLEFDTDERLGPASATMADLDGIAILGRIVEKSGQTYDGLYRLAGTYIPNGRISSGNDASARTSAGRSSGYHENFLISRQTSEDTLVDTLIPSILASRLYAMNGTLHKGGYVLSQKVWGAGGNPVERSLGRRTSHNQKPMLTIPPSVDDRDTTGYPHWARGEVRMADPGMSAVARFAGLAVVSLAFRVVELQRVIRTDRLKDMSLVDPVDAARTYAGDLTLTAVAQTQSEKNVTALNLQEIFLEHARELSEKVELPADEVLAIDVISGLVDALRLSKPARGEYTKEARARIDFVARHQFIARTVGLDAVAPANQVAMQRNLLWDRVLAAGPGLEYWRQWKDKDPVACSIATYADRNGSAPRSILRSRIIERNESRVLNWSSYADPLEIHRSLGEPYGE